MANDTLGTGKYVRISKVPNELRYQILIRKG